MSGQARLAACAALATLLTACALLPLVTPVTWLVEAALLVGLQTVAGALARRVPLPGALTVALQAAVTLLLLTVVFVRGQALLGLLPGPEAVRALGTLVGQGVRDVGQYATPAPVTDGIRLLLVGGVLIIALFVDALAVTYRAAAPAGLPLLALYSVASGLARGGGRWLWFLLAAGGYLLMLLAEERERLSRWGRVFGAGTPRPGQARPPGTAVAPVRTGRRIGALALGMALAFPAVLPAMGAGLLPAPGGAGFGPGAGTITAVNPLVSLQDSLNQPDDREVLRYRTTAADVPDMYLRIITLDEFDGTSWRASERRVGDVPDPLPVPAGLGAAVRTEPVSTSIAAARGYAQNYLPMPYPATRVRIAGEWRYEPEGRTLVGDRGQTTSGLQYQVASLQVEPTAQQLADAPPPPDALVREYTRVPPSLPDVVRSTAQQVTLGGVNAYQKAVRLQDWFTTSGGFTYDTRVAEGSGTDAIARFLHDKRGFCVHFAFTMAAMARTLGIPARVDVGFVPGTLQPDNSWSVGIKEAHAWPELYFEGVGWTRFEPTPSRGITPAYTRPDTPAAGGQDPGLPRRDPSAAPAPSDSATASCGPGHSGAAQGCGGAAQAAGDGPVPGGGPGGGTLAGAAAAVVLLLALAAVPMLWRGRTRTVRLSTGGALTAWRELLDTAWDYGVHPDDAETPRRAADRVIRSGALPRDAAEAVRRIGAAVEQTLYAPGPQPAADPALTADVRLVREAFHARAGRLARLRALWAPRSAARLVWRWSERRARAAATRRAVLRRVAAAVRLPRT